MSDTPIRLSAEHEQLVTQWAADDRLWTTQETVEFNLTVFARAVLAAERTAREQAETRLADACFHLKCAGRLLETAALDEHGADGDECLEQKRNIDTFLSSPAPPPMPAREERRKAEEPIGCVPILQPVGHSHGLYAVAVCLAHGYKWPESLPCPLCERTAREQAEARMVQEREWRDWLESELAHCQKAKNDFVSQVQEMTAALKAAKGDNLIEAARVIVAQRDALKLKLEAAKGAIEQALGDVTAGDWMTVKTRFSKATLDKMETTLSQLSGGHSHD